MCACVFVSSTKPPHQWHLQSKEAPLLFFVCFFSHFFSWRHTSILTPPVATVLTALSTAEDQMDSSKLTDLTTDDWQVKVCRQIQTSWLTLPTNPILIGRQYQPSEHSGQLSVHCHSFDTICFSVAWQKRMALFADTSSRTGTCLSVSFNVSPWPILNWVTGLWLTFDFDFHFSSPDQYWMWAHIWPKMRVWDGDDWQVVCPCKRDWLLVDVDVQLVLIELDSQLHQLPFPLPSHLPSSSTYLQMLLIDWMTQWQSGGAQCPAGVEGESVILLNDGGNSPDRKLDCPSASISKYSTYESVC